MTKEELIQQINSIFVDNTTGLVTPVDVKDILINIVNSLPGTTPVISPTPTPTRTPVPTPTPSASPSNKIAYFGWKNTNTLPTLSEIQGFQGSVSHNAGATIVANFSGANGVPYYLFMAELASEPVKTRWYESSINTEVINTQSTWQIDSTIVSGYRIYKTIFQTDFTLPVEFRVS